MTLPAVDVWWIALRNIGCAAHRDLYKPLLSFQCDRVSIPLHIEVPASLASLFITCVPLYAFFLAHLGEHVALSCLN